MDIYLKLSQLIHGGQFETVKTLLNNIHHPSKCSLYIQCLQSAVSVQRYDIAEYFIGKVPPDKDTAHFFKIAIRTNDCKMVDILLKNNPNPKVCSEAVFEAIEYNDINTIKKLLHSSSFVSEPTEYMVRAIQNGLPKILTYLFENKQPNEETMKILLKEALDPITWSQREGFLAQVLCDTMNYSSTEVLKDIANEFAKYQTPQLNQLNEYLSQRLQHAAITSAIGEMPQRPIVARKI